MTSPIDTAVYCPDCGNKITPAITKIVTKLLYQNVPDLVTEESPEHQFITPYKDHNGITYELHFVQIVHDTMFVIYKYV